MEFSFFCKSFGAAKPVNLFLNNTKSIKENFKFVRQHSVLGIEHCDFLASKERIQYSTQHDDLSFLKSPFVVGESLETVLSNM